MSSSSNIEQNKPKKKIFPVLNMHCAACAINAQAILKAQNGVLDANVSYTNATAIIEYTPDIIDEFQLRKVLQSVGYDLFLEETDDNDVNTKETAIRHLYNLQQSELQSLKTKAFFAALCSIPLLLVSYFLPTMPFEPYIMCIFATPVVFYCGGPFFVRAFKQALHKSCNMSTLVALSSGTAYLYSVFNTLFPEILISRHMAASTYFDVSAIVITIVLFGKFLEETIKSQMTGSVEKLINLLPKSVVTIVDEYGNTKKNQVKDIQKGDIIQVNPYEKIPVDGFIISGTPLIDESMLGGESILIEKKMGNTVFAGTVNQKDTFLFRAENLSDNTLLTQIIRQVENAQVSKIPIQKQTDAIVKIFVPVIICCAILALVLWILLGGEHQITHGLMAFISVLIIACPCALGLAIPSVIMTSIGKGSELGILIKDAECLEITKNINTVVFDKSGIITDGKPKIMNTFGETTNLLKLASITSISEEFISSELIEHFGETNFYPVKFVQKIPGFGASGTIEDKLYYVGRIGFMRKQGIKIGDSFMEKFGEWSEEGKSVAWVSDEKEALACVAFADQVKESSIKAIKKLHVLRINTYMLGPENPYVVKAIAHQAGIKNFKAEILSFGKKDFIKELQEKGKKVAFVAESADNSEALAQADISIAIGKEKDTIIDAAKMTIISNDINKVPQAIMLSELTSRIITQNLFLVLIYTIISIPIAGGVLYPFWGFILPPTIACLAMVLSSASVVLNSLRIKWKKLD